MSGPAKGMTVVCFRCRTRVGLPFSIAALGVDWCKDCASAKIIEVDQLKQELRDLRETFALAAAKKASHPLSTIDLREPVEAACKALDEEVKRSTGHLKSSLHPRLRAFADDTTKALTGRIDSSKPHHSQKPKKHPF